jgi:hypothetical protein
LFSFDTTATSSGARKRARSHQLESVLVRRFHEMSKRRKHSIIPQGASSSVEDDVSRRNKKRAARAAQKAQEIEKLKEAVRRHS